MRNYGLILLTLLLGSYLYKDWICLLLLLFKYLKDSISEY